MVFVDLKLWHLPIIFRFVGMNILLVKPCCISIIPKFNVTASLEVRKARQSPGYKSKNQMYAKPRNSRSLTRGLLCRSFLTPRNDDNILGLIALFKQGCFGLPFLYNNQYFRAIGGVKYEKIKLIDYERGSKS